MATCKKCGARLESGAVFCPVCGTKVLQETAISGVCAGCGTALEQGAKFCPSCGKKTEEPAADFSQERGAFCGVCGKPLEKDTKFCPSCGAKNGTSAETAAAVPSVSSAPETGNGADGFSAALPDKPEKAAAAEKKQKKQKKAMGIVIAVLTAAMVICGVLCAVFIPAKIREVRASSPPFNAEEWQEEQEDFYPPDERPDQWKPWEKHGLPEWYYDQKG